ncbi:uncharacterized protein TNCV_846071 [Trichonephila clavipes]|nr:uncharacterized protein TNCV_846071 [Trichonephila clavipes]
MSSKFARGSTDYRRKKRRVCGNQHSKDKTLEPVAVDVTSASSKKLCLDSDSYQSNSNKIIDVEVLSSYCKGCDRWKSLKYGTAYQEWKKSHEPYCVKNHSGSSNKMEVEGMKRFFKRSLLERNAKYVKYIGDGDTKTFSELQNTVSYNLEKNECVGNIQKRMGAKLRRLKLMNRGKNYQTAKVEVEKIA